MRGSPLLNALVAFIVIALTGIPILRLTAGTAAPATAEESVPKAAAASVPVELRFTTAPQGVKIRHLGKLVWSSDDPGTSVDGELSLPWPEEGVDLLFEVVWPEDAPLAAARVLLISPDGEEQVRSIWGPGPVSEVFTFR